MTCEPFAYRITDAGAVRVDRGGRLVCIVGGADAKRLIGRLGKDEATDQALLQRATGNYRRGNER